MNAYQSLSQQAYTRPGTISIQCGVSRAGFDEIEQHIIDISAVLGVNDNNPTYAESRGRWRDPIVTVASMAVGSQVQLSSFAIENRQGSSVVTMLKRPYNFEFDEPDRRIVLDVRSKYGFLIESDPRPLDIDIARLFQYVSRRASANQFVAKRAKQPMPLFPFGYKPAGIV